QILIALLRLGDLTRYVSESVILGFMAGAGVLVALTQIENLLGLPSRGSGADHLLYRLWLTWAQGAPIDYSSLAICPTTLAIIYALHRLSRKLKVRIPELLVTLLLVSFAVWWWRADVGPQGLQIDQRLPAFQLPPFRADWINQVWGGALAIALLGLTETLALAKAISAPSRPGFDYNRQCLAEGIANVGAGLFQCMPGSGSLTRTAINYYSGAATRLSGIVAAAAVAAALLALAPLAGFVPRAALAGILLWTAWRIVDRRRL